MYFIENKYKKNIYNSVLVNILISTTIYLYIRKIVQCGLSCIARHLATSWKLTFRSPDIREHFYNTPKLICISAHTTPYIDVIVLYITLVWSMTRCEGRANDDVGIYIRTLGIYTPTYCIEVPTSGGLINRELAGLSAKPAFCRILFPSGGTIRWKTGFYILAKSLGAKIAIVGIDYATRSVVIDSIIDPANTFEETKEICIARLRTYTPGPFWYILRRIFQYGCETYSP